MKTDKKTPSLFSMTMISISVLFVTGCVAGVHVPGTHSQQQTAKAQVRAVTVTSKSTKSPHVGDAVSFPGIISKALKVIQLKGIPSLSAPTVLPTSVFGKNHLSSKVTVQTRSTDTAYNVLFSAQHQRVADFSGNTYTTAMAARQGTFLSTGTLPKGVKKSSVKVDSIEATCITYQPKGNHNNGNSSPFALLRWTQDHWSITVREAGTTAVPLPEAQKVAHFLATHGLPTPNTQASLLVTVQAPTATVPANLDGRSVDAYGVWQTGKHVYETDAYSACKEPIETVFSMARSMQSYS